MRPPSPGCYSGSSSFCPVCPYRIFSYDQACFIPDSHQKHVWNVCKLRISHVEQGWTCLIENSHLFHVWNISHQIQAWNFSHQFTCENWVGFPRCRTVSRPITSTLSNTLWTNHIHQNNFDFLMKVGPPFWRLIVKHAMDICYIFLSSNEYIKKR